MQIRSSRPAGEEPAVCCTSCKAWRNALRHPAVGAAILDVELYRRDGVKCNSSRIPITPPIRSCTALSATHVSILDLLINVGDDSPRHICGAPDDTV
jgi:hypothetical protein